MNDTLTAQALWGVIIIGGASFIFWIGAILCDWIERKQEDQLRRRRRRQL